MGSNRRQPFGYTMEFGCIVTHQEEAEHVMLIFREYNRGASFTDVAEIMRQTGVEYDVGKPWNKNMVARILGDRRYLGENGFPPIIGEGDFQKAVSRRGSKSSPVQKTEAQKILLRKCNRRITEHIENEVLFLLNELARNPERIETPRVQKTGSGQVDSMKAELEKLLAQFPVDGEQARKMLLDTAAAMYECIDPREYETHRMRRLFQKESPRNELDALLIGMTITAVFADSNGAVRIQLKNDQIIGRGEENERIEKDGNSNTCQACRG